MVGAPFYLVTEVLSPFVEIVALASLVAAVALGLFELDVFLVVVAAMAFMNAALTAGAILLDDAVTAVPGPRSRTTVALVAIRPRPLSPDHHLGTNERTGVTCGATSPGTGSSATSAPRADRRRRARFGTAPDLSR
jgi:hypothetical protein